MGLLQAIFAALLSIAALVFATLSIIDGVFSIGKRRGGSIMIHYETEPVLFSFLMGALIVISLGVLAMSCYCLFVRGRR